MACLQYRSEGVPHPRHLLSGAYWRETDAGGIGQRWPVARTQHGSPALVALPPRSPVQAGVRGDLLDSGHQAALRRRTRPGVRAASAAQNVPTGLARPLPMMSKAEPWMGSTCWGSGARVDVAGGRNVMAARQRGGQVLRMSACGLVATMVSSVAGRLTMRAVAASTSSLSHFTSGKLLADCSASRPTSPWRGAGRCSW